LPLLKFQPSYIYRIFYGLIRLALDTVIKLRFPQNPENFLTRSGSGSTTRDSAPRRWIRCIYRHCQQRCTKDCQWTV